MSELESVCGEGVVGYGMIRTGIEEAVDIPPKLSKLKSEATEPSDSSTATY